MGGRDDLNAGADNHGFVFGEDDLPFKVVLCAAANWVFHVHDPHHYRVSD